MITKAPSHPPRGEENALQMAKLRLRLGLRLCFLPLLRCVTLLRLHRPNAVRVLSQCYTSTDEALLLCWQCKFTKIFPNYLNMVQLVYDESLTAVNFFGSSISCPSPLFMGLLENPLPKHLQMGRIFTKMELRKMQSSSPEMAF